MTIFLLARISIKTVICFHKSNGKVNYYSILGKVLNFNKQFDQNIYLACRNAGITHLYIESFFALDNSVRRIT